MIKMGNRTSSYTGALIKLELDLIDKIIFRDMYCLNCEVTMNDEKSRFCPQCANKLVRREKIDKGNLSDLFYELQEMILEEENLIYDCIFYERTVEVYLMANATPECKRGVKRYEDYRVTRENYLMDDFKETEETLKLLEEFRNAFTKEIDWLDSKLLNQEGIDYQLLYGHLVISEG